MNLASFAGSRIFSMKEHRILRRLGAKHNRQRVLFLGPLGPDLHYLPGLEGG